MEKLTKAQRAVVASQMKAANTMSNLEFLLPVKRLSKHRMGELVPMRVGNYIKI